MSLGYGKMDRYGGDPHQGYQIPPPVEPIKTRESNTMREMKELEQRLTELNNVIDALHSRLDSVVLPVPKPERTGNPVPQMCGIAGQINAFNNHLQHSLDRLYLLMEGVDL